MGDQQKALPFNCAGGGFFSTPKKKERFVSFKINVVFFLKYKKKRNKRALRARCSLRYAFVTVMAMFPVIVMFLGVTLFLVVAVLPEY